jgi:transmembrane sensor
VSDPQTGTLKPCAEEVRARAADWLARRVSENWSVQDQAELDAWLAESPAHRIAFLRVTAAWTHTYRLSALRVPEPSAAALSSRKRNWPIPLGIAAALAIVVSLGAAYVLRVPPDRVFKTSVGGHETIAFADGSKVELDTDTIIRARMTTHSRTIWLEKGEAYFSVKHDPAHPFVVLVGDHRVTDLGTKFIVRRDPSRLEVALLEGRVRFGESGDRSQSQLLLPGEVATVTSSTMFVTKETPRQLSRELSWRRGVLVFEKTPLAEAASEINRYNTGAKLVIADPAAAEITIDGAFPVNDTRVFLEAAQTLFGLRVQPRGDQIVISR